MTGGNQLRLSSVIGGTLLGRAIVDRHRAGAIVAGTSAGASAIASHMVAFGTSGATPKQRMTQMSAGLGLLPGVLIDQHFEQRNRFGRLLALVAQSPSLLGMGIDEDTAGLVSPKGVLEVLGKGSVTIIDPAKIHTDAYEVKRHRPIMVSGVVLHSLPSGYRFDIRRRKLMAPLRPVSATDRELASLQAATESHPASHSQHRGRGCRRHRSGTGPSTRAPSAAARGGGIRVTATPRASSRGAARRERAAACAPPGAKPKPELQIIETRVYRGPNYWNYEPTIKLVVDLGVLEHFPTNTITGFTEGLLQMLPDVGLHSCGTGRVGGFADRLAEGTWVGHVAEHIALQLQREAGTEVGRGKTRGTGEPGRYHVVYSYAEESVGVAAGQLAVRLVNHLVKAERDFDFVAELERLILLAERAALGPSTQAILDEAALRDIPYIRLNEQSLVQLGHGVHQQRIRATMTSLTGSLGVDIASDKKLTNRLLAATGVPVPRSEVVRDADGAVAAAGRIGYPVAMKPLDGNHGRGVMLNLTDEDAVRDAFPVAREQSRGGALVVEIVSRWERLPLPGHRRGAACGGAARAGPCRWRREAHGHRAGRGHQRGSAPRHRSREGADPDQDRRGVDRLRARAGVRAGRRAAASANGSTSSAPGT